MFQIRKEGPSSSWRNRTLVIFFNNYGNKILVGMKGFVSLKVPYMVRMKMCLGTFLSIRRNFLEILMLFLIRLLTKVCTT